MKRTLIILAAVITTTMACGQSRTGTFSLIPRVAVTLSNISKESMAFTSSVTNTDSPTKGKTKAGILAGLDLQYQATPMVAVSLGAFLPRWAADTMTPTIGGSPRSYDVFANNRFDLHYVSVPLMAHIYVARGLSVNGGVQASFLVDNNMYSDATKVTIGKDGSYTYTGLANTINKENDLVKKFELSIPVGISYEYENVVIDVRYQLGLTRIQSATRPRQQNREVVLSRGYKFDL
jgi:hypothetical protein